MEIIKSSAESVQLLTQTNYAELFKFAQAMVKNYLAYCFPNQVGIAAQFTADLISKNPSWKAADFINVFKFFRLNSDNEDLKTFGNSITPQRLMEMVAVYENHRVDAIEQLQAKRKGEDLTVSERGQGNSIKALMGKEMERVEEKNEKLRLQGHSQEYKGKSDETFFERKAVNK